AGERRRIIQKSHRGIGVSGSSKASISVPWDESAIGLRWTASIFGVFLWLLFGCVLGTIAFALLITTSEGIYDSKFKADDLAMLLVIGLASILLCFGTGYAFRNASRATERRRAKVLNRKCSLFSEWSHVLLVPKGILVALEGYGRVVFSD